jgi:GT2 family glycosyltransferase
MKRSATIILNRNLPEITDSLCKHIKKHDGDLTDIYVLESGSDYDNLSKNTSWHANHEEAMQQGLRYQRGMNYALFQLFKEEKLDSYDYFLLLTNDTVLENKPSLEVLFKIMDSNKKIGILSPCSKNWGEKLLLEEKKTKYFWFIHNNSYVIRKEFLQTVMNDKDDNWESFFYDGSNFRGYLSESEVIAKAYINNWAAAITSEVWVEENESYLLNKSSLIKTESYDDNIKLYIEEGLEWIKQKYGFTNKWQMNLYVKLMYENYFSFHPDESKFKL